MCPKKIYNYKIDDWVIYQPYEFSTPKRAVILWIYRDEEPLYDYEIYIDGEGKKRKVVESSLFPINTPTY